MKILLFIYSLGSGGAERVCVNMANDWANKGHDITILTFTGTEHDFYALASTIQRETLGVSDALDSSGWAKITRNLDWIKKIRGCLNKYCPDVIIPFMTTANVLALLATRGMKIPVIITEHTNPEKYSPGFQWQVIRRLTYPFASILVSVSKGVSRCFSWLPAVRCGVIPNMLAPKFENLKMIQSSLKKKQIISVGRLHSEKGLDQLLVAFAQIFDKNPDWNLLILGEGDERLKLEQQIEMLQIDKRVKMPGAVDDLIPFLQESALFVLSSHFEGFGNVIVEAMACGLPVIATDCDYGPSEIITDGEDGLLIPVGDTNALAEAMEKLIQDEPERNRLAKNAQKNVRRFYIDNIMRQWEMLIQDKNL